MQLPVEITNHIRESVFPFSTYSCHPLGGGCINHAGQFSAGGRSYFIKYNETPGSEAMFSAEARGLELLRQTRTVRIPEVIATAGTGRYAYILEEIIKPGPPAFLFWEHFGENLAAMHRHAAARFGLDHGNYIALLPQSNRFHDNWQDYIFVECWQPQMNRSLAEGLLTTADAGDLEKLYKKLSGLVPAELPALLHGDLWNGNYMVSSAGEACLIDPAVYFGHRETDLAMTKLFGGFAEAFYASYHAAFPLEKGWQHRMDIHQLYPLLVHVNLFGSSYVPQVRSILRKYA